MDKKGAASRWNEVFSKEFGKESDRASVIISVAMLDHALETILKAHLVPTGSAEDSLLEGAYTPISSFNARIDLTYRLGLISAQFCRDLHIIRRIRNDFAHSISSCSFKDTNVHSRITELVRSSAIIERDPETRATFVKGVRGDFEMVVSWMLWHLWSLSEKVVPIRPPVIEWGYRTKAEVNEKSKKHEGE